MTFIPENVARKSYKNVMEKLNFVMEKAKFCQKIF